ncbi:MAG: DEAD/DEAH box helicase family protein [Patescibacteria group bacterium]
MRHSQIRKTLAENLASTLATNSLPFPLYGYQLETLESTIRWLKRARASRWAYVAQATGLGKTYEFSVIVKACRGLRVLVIVPGKTLIGQTIVELVKFTEGTIAHASSLKTITDDKDGVIAEHWKGRSHDVLVTTDETFKVQYERLKHELDPDVVIWDECHWSYTEKALRALNHFHEAVVIGFTATPDYLTTAAKPDYISVQLDNGQTLYCPPDRMARTYYPELLDERSPKWGIEHGYLAPLAWGQLQFTLDLDDVPVVDGPAGLDYDQKELQYVIREKWDFLVQIVRQLYQSGQYDIGSRFSAAICPGVHEAQTIAEELRGIGIIAESITGETRDTDVWNILERGKKGDIQFLSSVYKLREGWNSPNAEIGMMLRPTPSRVLYMQFLGRILRRYGDKVALALDPHYLGERFAPLSVPVLFGEPGQRVYDGGIIVGPRKKRGGRKPISPYLLANIHLLKPVLTVKKIEIEYWAGADGTFIADGEVWGTLDALASILSLAWLTVRKYSTPCRKREGKGNGGVPATFYSLSDMREACADLLEKMPRAGKDGTFTADGEVWGMLDALARILCISRPTLHNRSVSCRCGEGKNHGGVLATFYSLSDMREACADLLEKMPRAGKDGTFTADGEVWGTTQAVTRILGLSKAWVTSRGFRCRKKKGKNQSGLVTDFYAVSDAKNVCSDLLQEMPKAGKDGMFRVDGEEWGTVEALTRKLPISRPAVLAKIFSFRSLKGKNCVGRVVDIYRLTDVKNACADLIKKRGGVRKGG